MESRESRNETRSLAESILLNDTFVQIDKVTQEGLLEAMREPVVEKNVESLICGMRCFLFLRTGHMG